MEAEVYLIQPWGRKTGRSSFSLFPFTDPVICATALALQTGKCQSQISLSPKVLCARFSAQRYQDPGQFYFKWNTHTKQTLSRSSRCALSVLWQEPFSLFRKRPRTHLCMRTVNSMEKKKTSKNHYFFKKTYMILCNHYLWDNKLWQGRVLLWFLSLRHGLQCTQWMAKFLRHKEVSNWSKKLGNSSSVSCLFFNELSISSSIRLNFFMGQTGPGHLEYVFVLCFLLVDWAIAKLMHSSWAFFFVADCKDSC